MFWSELDILIAEDRTDDRVTNLVWSKDASAWSKKQW